LLELSGVLRSEPAVAPRGVVLAQRILTDPESPLYFASREDGLWHDLRQATAALVERN
jgi:hypothetical protein